MTTNIYVLQLEGNKWYVGKAANVEARYQQHLNGQGSMWTQKYKPVSLVETLNGVSPFEEDKKTKELMAKYGVQNVRGGTYVTEQLTPEQILGIKQEIWGAKDCCTRCGDSSHFVRDCEAETDVEGEPLDDELDVWCCELCDAEFISEREAEQHERSCGKQDTKNVAGSCFRCGRQGHYANNCYARTTVRGDYITDSEDDEDDDEW
jgi:predicted GIY-YIG superfamily endonuclease